MARDVLSVWEAAADASADPQRARHYFTEMRNGLEADLLARLAPEQARILAALFSGSKALSELLLTRPEWMDLLDAERLESPRQKQGVRREARAFLEPALEQRDYTGALTKLRLMKQKEMLRIAARDLARFGTVPQITEEISNIADVCIEGVYRVCFQQLVEKFGTPYALDPITNRWNESAFCVLGMGKLGGQELNYSSDIDVLFAYSGEGEAFKTPPGKSTKRSRGLANHQFYARLAECIVTECTRMTSEGFLFRIDLRLRPEGKTAPLARSISSYENYYAQWGQTWERMMLIKARCVGGDESLGAEFLEMIQPFRYPRSISEQIPREVAEMKERIENEVIRAGELDRNVKLGRGGIREIEFLVQTQQVLHAGRNPFLQGAKTLPLLRKLSEYHLIQEDQASELTRAYCFLRDVEHRLQMEDNRQTHTIPTNRDARERLARLMGFKTLPDFEKEIQRIHDQVRSVYDQFIKPDKSKTQFPAEIENNGVEWKRILEDHSFREPERCLKLVQEFVQGPGFGHRSSRTVDHSMQLLGQLLEMCPKRGGEAPAEPFLSDPDRVLARLDSFVARYGARSMLFDAWVSNPSLFRLLLLAFDRSEFLAELAIRVPDLVDEIEQSGQLRRRKTTEQVLEDLRHGAADADQFQWLRRYFQAEQMRIGLRDILDLADPAQTQAELSALADACLAYALEAVMRKHKLRKAPFAIFGLGKLGGRELIYASDLDILFVADDSVPNLSALQKFAVELMDLLAKRTEDGVTFDTDARLRPDGEKGLIVNTLKGYAEYYQKRAALWEIQSLSRFRAICGNEVVSRKFAAAAAKFTDFSGKPKRVVAFTPNWKQEIHKMRMRIEKERTPSGKDALAIKTGRGGLMDVEFVAQALSLEHGWREPNTLSAIERAVREKVLASRSGDVLAGNYRKLIQIERILRRWSFQAESHLPEDPAAYYRVAVRCGYRKSEDFREGVKSLREEVRAEYLRFFGASD